MGPFSQLLKNRFSIHLRLSAMLICLAAPFTSLGQTTAPALQIFAKDMREEIVRINVTVKDLYNRQETRPMPITIYRPAGDGPFPLVVFNHGRATTDKRAAQGRYRPEHAARYLVTKGFVVFVPVRVGYWETYVDASRWLVAGVSVGGLTTVATVGRNPKGLLGGINFSGGSGGDPVKNPGRPCSPSRISSYWGSLAKNSSVPMLWLYWQNDKYWGEEIPVVAQNLWVTEEFSRGF